MNETVILAGAIVGVISLLAFVLLVMFLIYLEDREHQKYVKKGYVNLKARRKKLEEDKK